MFHRSKMFGGVSASVKMGGHVKVTSIKMPGPKVSEKNIAQGITLPLLDCFFPIVHPEAISSAGKRNTNLAIAMM